MSGQFAGFEIVGLDGDAAHQCEEVLPVIRVQGSGWYAKLSTEDTAESLNKLHWYSPEEFEHNVSVGHVTELLPDYLVTTKSPPPAARRKLTTHQKFSVGHQHTPSQPVAFAGALVAYFRDRVFSEAKVEDPIPFLRGHGCELIWELERGEKIIAVCAVHDRITRLMEVFAVRLRFQFIELLQHVLRNTPVDTPEDWFPQANWFFEVGSSAAKSQKHKEAFYLFYGAAALQAGDTAAYQGTFDLLRLTIPGWTQEAYQQQVENRIPEMLFTRAKLQEQALRESTDPQRFFESLIGEWEEAKVQAHGGNWSERVDRAVATAQRWERTVEPRISEMQAAEIERKIQKLLNGGLRSPLPPRIPVGHAEHIRYLATRAFFWLYPQVWSLKLRGEECVCQIVRAQLEDARVDAENRQELDEELLPWKYPIKPRHQEGNFRTATNYVGAE